MSGSSLDGLDLAWCKFQVLESGIIGSFELMDFAEVNINEEWKTKLSKSSKMPVLDLLRLNSEYGEFIGSCIKKTADSHFWKADLIGVHGHTVFHYPDQEITFQLGHGAYIAASSGIETITDFRSGDLAWGGVGAPMAPKVEKLLFPSHCSFLNLGGIANISFHEERKITAFDICGCNQLLNLLAQRKHLSYDKDGKLASKGNINNALLKHLSENEYFANAPPKAIDNNWLQHTFFPIFDNYKKLRVEDLLATTVEHIVDSIHNSLQFSKHIKTKTIVATGGGAHNKFLIKRLIEKCSPEWEIVIPSKQLINGKEAILIAYSAILRYLNQPNFFNSVTGATKETIGGCIYHP
jgi:anhydro-N-acetylmuramic acid kinase